MCTAAQNAKGRIAAAFCPRMQAPQSALARLETRIGLADHEDLAAAPDDLAVAVAGFRRLQGGQDLHDEPLENGLGQIKPVILAGIISSNQGVGGSQP
jgi:hypothetical protein